MNIINKEPWPQYGIISGDLLSVGLSISGLIVNQGGFTKYIWIPLAIGLVFTFAYYKNAYETCKDKSDKAEKP